MKCEDPLLRVKSILVQEVEVSSSVETFQKHTELLHVRPTSSNTNHKIDFRLPACCKFSGSPVSLLQNFHYSKEQLWWIRRQIHLFISSGLSTNDCYTIVVSCRLLEIDNHKMHSVHISS